jgi:tetratricopeptide (TPR) repeat protein
MRKLLLVVWLLVPVAAGAYHYGPGQERLELDEAAALIDEAETHAKAGEHAEAVEVYGKALDLLPVRMVDKAQRLRLERAKAQMLSKQLPEARGDLQTLLADLTADETADPELTDEVRSTLANSQYYMTWLMRLEGRGREEWEPEIEASRQNYRLLAENSKDADDEKSIQRHQKDLESAIRLARLDLKDLQGLPLPSQ